MGLIQKLHRKRTLKVLAEFGITENELQLLPEIIKLVKEMSVTKQTNNAPKDKKKDKKYIASPVDVVAMFAEDEGGFNFNGR